MKYSSFLNTGTLPFLLLVSLFLFHFHLQKFVFRSSDSKNTNNELIVRIATKARPISLPSPSFSRFVIVTMGTYAYRDYITSMACSFIRNSNNGTSPFQILLLSLDLRLHNFPMPPNVHSVYFDETARNYTGKEPVAKYNAPEFDLVTRQKLAAIRSVLTAGFDVLYTDGDVVWCDPSRAVMDIVSQAHPSRAPIVAQTAHVDGQVMNTGLLYAVSCPNSLSFFHSAEMLPSEEGNDQDAANALACEAKFGGQQLDNDHCRWKNRTNIRALQPKDRYILGATKIEGIEMRKLRAKKVGHLCNSKVIGLMHYSFYHYNEKRRGMEDAGLWYSNKDTPGRCSKRKNEGK